MFDRNRADLGHISHFAISRWGAATYVLLFISAGLLGSAYATDLRSLPPISWFADAPAVAFWLLVLLAALLYFNRQHAISQNREKAELTMQDRADRLERKSNELAGLVRTMPPEAFLSKFREIHRTCEDSVYFGYVAEGKNHAIDELHRAIRSVLGNIMVLAASFDGRPAGRVYGTNLMIFKSTAELDRGKREKIESRLRFCPPEVCVERLYGVLDLDVQLSVSSIDESEDELAPDPALEPIALPVPEEPRNPDTDKWRILPGAPMAFHKERMDAEKGFDGYDDISTLPEFCRKSCELPGVVNEVSAYFSGLDDTIRSFRSIAVPYGVNESPLAVLNIHANQTDVLGGEEQITYFLDLVGPFTVKLERLLRQLSKAEEDRDT